MATEVTIRITARSGSTTEPTKEALDQALAESMWTAMGGAAIEHDAFNAAIRAGFGRIGTDVPVRGL